MSTPKYRSQDQRDIVVDAVKYLVNIQDETRLITIETLDLIRQSYIDLIDPCQTPASELTYREDS